MTSNDSASSAARLIAAWDSLSDTPRAPRGTRASRCRAGPRRHESRRLPFGCRSGVVRPERSTPTHSAEPSLATPYRVTTQLIRRARDTEQHPVPRLRSRFPMLVRANIADLIAAAYSDSMATNLTSIRTSCAPSTRDARWRAHVDDVRSPMASWCGRADLIAPGALHIERRSDTRGQLDFGRMCGMRSRPSPIRLKVEQAGRPSRRRQSDSLVPAHHIGRVTGNSARSKVRPMAIGWLHVVTLRMSGIERNLSADGFSL